MMAGQQPPPPVYVTAQQFLNSTRPIRQKVASAKAYLDGGATRDQLPQAGLADKLLMYVTFTITVAGTVTSGTWQSFNNGTPAPWSILKNIQFGSNNSLLLRNFSGWSMYKWCRYRYGQDPKQTVGVNYSANTLAALGLNQSSGIIVPGANVVAGTYTFNVGIPIDLAYNKCAEQSLLSLQNNNTIYTLTTTWGQITTGITPTGGTNDLFNALVGTGLTVTCTGTYTVGLDTWDVPNFPSNYSLANLMGTYLSVSDYIQATLNNGTNTVRPPQNNIYTMIGLEVINAGAPVAVANIQAPQWTYANNMYPFVEDYVTVLNRDNWYHTIPSVDGNIWYDLGIRRGQLERRDLLDGFDDSSITNLALQYNLPGTLSITGTNQTNVVLENLNTFTQ